MPFEKCDKFKGFREGWIFKLGVHGLGYYRDVFYTWEDVPVNEDGSRKDAIANGVNGDHSPSAKRRKKDDDAMDVDQQVGS